MNEITHIASTGEPRRGGRARRRRKLRFAQPVQARGGRSKPERAALISTGTPASSGSCTPHPQRARVNRPRAAEQSAPPSAAARTAGRKTDGPLCTARRIHTETCPATPHVSALSRVVRCVRAGISRLHATPVSSHCAVWEQCEQMRRPRFPVTRINRDETGKIMRRGGSLRLQRRSSMAFVMRRPRCDFSTAP